jgi:hypothetical protein
MSSHTKDCTNGRVESLPIWYCTTGRMEAKSKQGMYKWKIRSLVPAGTTQMEGWKSSPIRDYPNGRTEIKSHQGLQKWKVRSLAPSGTVHMEG